MVDINIAVIHKSTVVTAQQVQDALPALQTQVSRDFAPVWGIDATLSFVPNGTVPPADSWWLAVLDNSDQAGALGYHDVTTQGLPLGKVFAGSDVQYGYQWTVTFSHELLEMLADPEINLTVFDQPSATSGRLYAYEVCDACEADQYGYDINGTLVSDFVYPSWFQASRTNGTFDHGGHIKVPFELLPGGYIGIFDVGSGTGWTQLTPPSAQLHYDNRPHVGSRRERRRTPRDQWLPSTPR
jgi:hypothetical protein